MNKKRSSGRTRSHDAVAPHSRTLLTGALLIGATAIAWVNLKPHESEPQQFEVSKAELDALENLTDEEILDMRIGKYLVFRAGQGENLSEISSRIDGAVSVEGSDPSLDDVIDEVRKQAIAHDGTPSFDEGERFITNRPPSRSVVIP